MDIKSLFTSCHQSKLAEESKTSCCLQVWCLSPWDPWIPALWECWLLKCLPLWSKRVLNIFLSLLHQQVIHPPESHLSPHVGTLKLSIIALANLEMAASWLRLFISEISIDNGPSSLFCWVPGSALYWIFWMIYVTSQRCKFSLMPLISSSVWS